MCCSPSVDREFGRRARNGLALTRRWISTSVAVNFHHGLALRRRPAPCRIGVRSRRRPCRPLGEPDHVGGQDALRIEPDALRRHRDDDRSLLALVFFPARLVLAVPRSGASSLAAAAGDSGRASRSTTCTAFRVSSLAEFGAGFRRGNRRARRKSPRPPAPRPAPARDSRAGWSPARSTPQRHDHRPLRVASAPRSAARCRQRRPETARSGRGARPSPPCGPTSSRKSARMAAVQSASAAQNLLDLPRDVGHLRRIRVQVVPFDGIGQDTLPFRSVTSPRAAGGLIGVLLLTLPGRGGYPLLVRHDLQEHEARFNPDNPQRERAEDRAGGGPSSGSASAPRTRRPDGRRNLPVH